MENINPVAQVELAGNNLPEGAQMVAAPAAQAAAAGERGRGVSRGYVRGNDRVRRRIRRGLGRGGPIRGALPVDPFVPPKEGEPNPAADYAAQFRAHMEFEAAMGSSNPQGDGPTPEDDN